MTTELIAGTKPAISKGKDMVIITTTSGAAIWVPKHQFEPNSDQVSYEPLKAGHKYMKDGKEFETSKDRNEFVCAGVQRIKKYDAKEILASVVAAGVTPSFSLS